MEIAIGEIIAIALGSVLVIIIFTFLFLAYIFRKRLKRFWGRKKMTGVYKPSVEDPDHQSISSNRTFDTNSTELSRYAFIKSCSKKLENNKQLLHEEFQNLPDYTLSKSSSVSKQKVNLLKNRYSNIDAFNHTRVILNDKTSAEDYINANFVQGFSNPKKFIATQGPKIETLGDFWRMIYLHDVKAIVMLTNLVENGVKKCQQYWPSAVNKPITYGDCQVTLVEEVVISDYVMRRFDLVVHSGTDNKKQLSTTVSHYYYQKWYDRGVPDTYPISILKLIRDVNENHPKSGDHPIVVHCSAGVGRTGTYITLDAMLENLDASENFIDIFEFVSKIRMQRSYLVQTIAQYIFIYDALHDYCIFGFTDIKTDKLPEAYERLKKQAITGGSKSSKDIDQLQVEFDKLHIQKPLMTSTQTAQEHPEFNRDPDIVCYDDNRVKLKGVGKASYINATNTLDSFVITQDPMETDIHQFWRMVLENNIKIVVGLNKDFMLEYNKLSWPTSENPCCILESNDIKYELKLLDDTKITDIDDEGTDPIRDDDIVLVRFLKIVDHSNQKEFHVTNVILNHAWPTSTRPSDSWSCVELAKRIGHFYEICKSPNILLHGYGGDSNCLLVCALYVLVDQLMFENSVDIFNVVKYLNTQRCNTKINYDQYDYLYKCLADVSTNKNKAS